MEPVGLCAGSTFILPELAPPAESSFPVPSPRDTLADLPAAPVSDLLALFELHRAWAEAIGRTLHRRLPPSFDVDDLEQIARIENWRCVKTWEPGRGVPYRAFAYFPIRGAVLMACRRRHYREAMHEPLDGRYLDDRATPEELLLDREERRNITGPRDYRQRAKIRVAMAALPSDDAQLLRLVYFEYADVEELERSMPGTKRRLTRAVGRLRRAVAKAPHLPAAAVPTEHSFATSAQI